MRKADRQVDMCRKDNRRKNRDVTKKEERGKTELQGHKAAFLIK